MVTPVLAMSLCRGKMLIVGSATRYSVFSGVAAQVTFRTNHSHGEMCTTSTKVALSFSPPVAPADRCCLPQLYLIHSHAQFLQNGAERYP